MKGRLIVFEGIDGSGKSTQAKMLHEYFLSKNIKSVLTFEPTEGLYGKKIRDSFLSERLSKEEELSLFTLDRKEHLEKFVVPQIEDGIAVVMDRYYYSTAAYQSAGGADIKSVLSEQESFAMKPDITFIILISVKEALQRIMERGKANSFEKEYELMKVYEAYKSIRSDEIVFIDASLLDVNSLHVKIIDILTEKNII